MESGTPWARERPGHPTPAEAAAPPTDTLRRRRITTPEPCDTEQRRYRMGDYRFTACDRRDALQKAAQAVRDGATAPLDEYGGAFTAEEVYETVIHDAPGEKHDPSW